MVRTLSLLLQFLACIAEKPSITPVSPTLHLAHQHRRMVFPQNSQCEWKRRIIRVIVFFGDYKLYEDCGGGIVELALVGGSEIDAGFCAT